MNLHNFFLHQAVFINFFSATLQHVFAPQKEKMKCTKPGNHNEHVKCLQIIYKHASYVVVGDSLPSAPAWWWRMVF